MAVSMPAISITPSSGISSQASRSSCPNACMRCTPAQAEQRRQRDTASPAGRASRAGRSGAAPRAPPSTREPGGQRLGAVAHGSAALGRRRRVCAPGPAARCISTTSSQRPNFQPTGSSMPAWLESPARGARRSSRVGRVADHRQHLPRTRGLAARHQFGQQQPPMPRPCASGVAGRSSPRRRSGRPAAAGMAGVGIAQHLRRRARPPARAGPWPARRRRRRAISAWSGGVQLEGAGAVRDRWRVDSR